MERKVLSGTYWNHRGNVENMHSKGQAGENFVKVSRSRGTQSGNKGFRWSMLARIIKGSKWMAWEQPI